ncbi:MAG TPA: hypothetical protein ENJ95_19920 [Bacteroidetes bacterium]|nr:hypothetical protein [Bacteroidota bacterium]
MKNGLIHIITKKIDEIQGVDAYLFAKGANKDGEQIDGIIHVGRGRYQKDWNVEVKHHLTPAMLPKLIDQIKSVKPIIVMAQYITPEAKKILQHKNIAFADAAGNVFLADDQLYIYIENRKAERKRPTDANRAFTKTGLKVLYLLLEQPDYINETYRAIAEKTGTGLDTINKVIKALQKEKFIIALDNRKYKWNNREILFIKWTEAYTKTLKPKLQQQTFKALNIKQNWKKLKLPEGTHWGGANAGELLTDYLIADKWTLYTDQDFVTIMKKLKWIPDPNGNIVLIKKFWKENTKANHVPPLIAYADLTETDNPRYIETAKIIYEKYIEGNL